MPAIAQASVGMTWLLDLTIPRYAMSGFHIEAGGFQYAAAIDARQRDELLPLLMNGQVEVKQLNSDL